jgi:hypothetical protein
MSLRVRTSQLLFDVVQFGGEPSQRERGARGAGDVADARAGGVVADVVDAAGAGFAGRLLITALRRINRAKSQDFARKNGEGGIRTRDPPFGRYAISSRAP